MHVHVGVGDHSATVLARLVAGHVFFFTFLAVNWVGIFEKFSVAEVAYDAFGSGHGFPTVDVVKEKKINPAKTCHAPEIVSFF